LAQAAVVQVEADPAVAAVEEEDAAVVVAEVVVADEAVVGKIRAVLITGSSQVSATAGAPSPLIQGRYR